MTWMGRAKPPFSSFCQLGPCLCLQDGRKSLSLLFSLAIYSPQIIKQMSLSRIRRGHLAGGPYGESTGSLGG